MRYRHGPLRTRGMPACAAACGPPCAASESRPPCAASESRPPCAASESRPPCAAFKSRPPCAGTLAACAPGIDIPPARGPWRCLRAARKREYACPYSRQRGPLCARTLAGAPGRRAVRHVQQSANCAPVLCARTLASAVRAGQAYSGAGGSGTAGWPSAWAEGSVVNGQWSNGQWRPLSLSLAGVTRYRARVHWRVAGAGPLFCLHRRGLVSCSVAFTHTHTHTDIYI